VTDLESLVEPATRGALLAASEPVISVDTKKKELLAISSIATNVGQSMIDCRSRQPADPRIKLTRHVPTPVPPRQQSDAALFI
jgi:hypothetical protein